MLIYVCLFLYVSPYSSNILKIRVVRLKFLIAFLVREEVLLVSPHRLKLGVGLSYVDYVVRGMFPVFEDSIFRGC